MCWKSAIIVQNTQNTRLRSIWDSIPKPPTTSVWLGKSLHLPSKIGKKEMSQLFCDTASWSHEWEACVSVGCAWLNWVSAPVLWDVKIPLWTILKQDVELWWFLANSQHLRSPLQSTCVRVLCSQVLGVDGNRENPPGVVPLVLYCNLNDKVQMLFLPGKRSGKEQLQSNSDYDDPRQNSFHRCICWT